MPLTPPQTVHGTTIAIGGIGVMLTGPSGSGKSDLALRCLAVPRCAINRHGVKLVSDDRVILQREGGSIFASAPDPIRSLIEVRGIGVIRVDDVEPRVPVSLIVRLGQAQTDRMPPEPLDSLEFLGVPIPAIDLVAFEASTPLKIILAAVWLTQAGITGPALP